MKIGSLFSGIGGFDLAAKWIGWETRWYSEIDPYAIRVMERHFPDAYNVGDIATFLADTRHWTFDLGTRQEGTQYKGRTSEREGLGGYSVDVLCGGFPCQPVSCAGKQLAQADPRWLWPHFARIIRVLRPRYVVAENVPGLLGRGATDVLRDFAALGYDVEWETIPASAVGAPHRRDRVWFLAYSQGVNGSRPKPSGDRRQRPEVSTGNGGDVTDYVGNASSGGLSGDNGRQYGAQLTNRRSRQPCSGPAKPDFRRVADGIPEGLHGGWEREWDGVPRVATGVKYRVDRLKCLGNAIVPQIAYELFRWIEKRAEMSKAA